MGYGHSGGVNGSRENNESGRETHIYQITVLIGTILAVDRSKKIVSNDGNSVTVVE